MYIVKVGNQEIVHNDWNMAVKAGSAHQNYSSDVTISNERGELFVTFHRLVSMRERDD